MHTIDKEQFGRFVAALRKDRGLTQKDLAQQLYLSDKAVSKWETGGSVPDIAVLTPLAEALGVTVAELLACRRLEGQQPMDSNEVDHLVQKALHLSEGESDNLPRKKRVAQYLLCLGLCAAELGAVFSLRRILNAPLLVSVLLGAVFGVYFFLFAGGRLPAYYDENRISSFSHGPVRLNLSGLVYFNNRNWPHILRVCRIWCGCMMVLWPLLYLGAATLLPDIWQTRGLQLCLAIILGGLFVPIVVVGRKHE